MSIPSTDSALTPEEWKLLGAHDDELAAHGAFLRLWTDRGRLSILRERRARAAPSPAPARRPHEPPGVPTPPDA